MPMAKKSSASKVARAQRAGRSGGGGGGGRRRELAFPAAVAAIIVLGVLLVAYARGERDAVANPTLEDHWHSAYGVYDCESDSFLAPFENQEDPFGIHSHGDGLIHIHPFSSQVTGDSARMGVFLDAVGATVTTDAIVLPDGSELTAGTECDGEPAIVQVWRWDLDASDGDAEVITDDFDDIRFRKDREAYTIALAPEGAEPVQPPTVSGVDQASDEIESTGVPATTAPAGVTTTAAADGEATTTTAAADGEATTTTAAADAEATTTTAP